MAIYTMHVVDRGMGDVNPALFEQGLAPGLLARMQQQAATTLPLDQSLAPSPGAPTTVAGDFFDQWGVPIAAGVTAFVAGLALAKFATARKRR